MVKFVITSDYRFWWPVKVRLPSSDPRKAGNRLEFGFKVQFEVVGTEEADAILAEVNALPVDERAARQHDLLVRVVRDWDEDIVDDEGQPVPFDEATLRRLLDNPYFATGLWRAWGDSQRDEGARKKN